MARHFLVLAALLQFFTCPAPGQSGAVHATASEFVVIADLDGDGRTDTAIIDRPTGAIRVAYQTSPGSHAWSATRATGLSNLTGVSAGRLLSLSRDALVVASDEANRLLAFDLSNSASPAIPVEIYPAGIGPVFPAAVGLPGPGDTAFDDLVTVSVLNGTKPYRIARTRNANGSDFSPIDETPSEPEILDLRRLSRAALLPGYSVAFRDESRSRVEIFDTTAVPISRAWNVTNLPPLPAHLVASFNDGKTRHLLSWESGGIQLNYVNLAAGTPTANAEESHTPVPEGIRHAFLIPQPTAPPLVLLLSANADLATLMSFDGTNTWTTLTAFPPPDSAGFTAASGLADGGFLLMAGSGLRSSQFQRIQRQGTTFSAGPWSGLPQLPAVAGGGNVLEFASEPFVSSAPHLLRSRNIPDWTSSLALGAGPPSLKVIAESYQGSVPGLDTPTSAILGAPHPSTQFGLVNQFADVISFYSFAPAVGDLVSDVAIHPRPGRYKTGIAFTFTVANPLHQVRYQLNQTGDWILYAGTPVALSENTSVRFYAQPPLGASRSPLQSAFFEFTRPPATLDSNGDGLPDFVARGRNLDPHSDGDTDDDGVDDLRELLSGTNPSDPNSKPATDPLKAPSAGRTIQIRLRPFDPASSNRTVASLGTAVRAYSLAGGLLGTGAISNPPAASGTNTARIAQLQVDPEFPLVVVATDPHFSVVTSGQDRHTGRELIALLAPGAAAPVAIPYTYGSAGGALPAEASAWIEATRKATAPTLQVPKPPKDVDALDALSASLAEAWIAGALWARGIPEATNLTLFPFRAGDSTRWTASSPLLRSLLQSAPPMAEGQPPPPPPPPSGPLYIPSNPVLQIGNLPDPPFLPALDSPGLALRTLAEAIYAQGARSQKPNSDQPRFKPLFETLPYDALRQFVWTGTLPPDYAAELARPPAELAAAFQGVLDTLARTGTRTPTNLTLRIRADSFNGPCTSLARVSGNSEPVALFDSLGTAYKLPETFDLPEGTLLEVQGFSIVSVNACGSAAVEVISARVTSLPDVPLVDANGNLLPDDWERLFLGGLSQSPFADADHDGFPDVQEMQEGSNPADALSHPHVAPLELAEPEMDIRVAPSGEIEVHWVHPPAFARAAGPAWQFALLGAPALNGPFTLLASRAAEVDGDIRLALPPVTDAARFFRLQLQLVRR